MSTAAQKTQLLNSLKETLSELARLEARGAAIAKAFVDRGYDAAALDPITVAELDAYGVIVFDLGAAINLLQAHTTFMADATRSATVSKWRQV